MDFIVKSIQNEPELLENKNPLKRLLLDSGLFDASSDKKKCIRDMLQAFEILPRIKQGNVDEIEKAVIINNLSKEVSTLQAYEVFSLWEEIIRQAFGEVSSAAFALDELNTEISYINPELPNHSLGIYIPCGIGSTDKGFFIKGIHRANVCGHKNAEIYALVYNMLTRNCQIENDDQEKIFSVNNNSYTVDYKSVFRLAIVILTMIKNNVKLEINFGNSAVLKQATNLIDYYADIFCKIIKTGPVRLIVNNTATGVKISLDEECKDGICVVNNTGVHSPAREVWFGRQINYCLGNSDKKNVEVLLRHVSPYASFKEGQYEVLCGMLNSTANSVCIMPTGSGKSLIFYLASFLQPLPIFVVSPTDILIEDQLRNLKEIHHIDNVAHLKLTDGAYFVGYEISNGINYLTPTTLQTRDLLTSFRYINNGTKLIDRKEISFSSGPLASYIVLDEIHCISNWGHDFRPEYLMLSKYIRKFFGRIRLLGFTATANYSVVEDIQKQLEIPETNFYSPISFEKYNVRYSFYEEKNEEAMFLRLSEIVKKALERHERTIIFTKDDEISNVLADRIGFSADVFTNDNPKAYQRFADEKCIILIAAEDLGIGINFPNIRNTIHFGLPLSKSEYVQEIGRAGRANEKVNSYVIFLEGTSQNVPEGLLRRDTAIKKIPDLITQTKNDFQKIYQKITNYCPRSEVLYNDLIKLKHGFDIQKQVLYVKTCSETDFRSYTQKLYMLYVTGFVNDWYSYKYNGAEKAVDVMIDICDTDSNSYRSNPKKMIARMKQRICEYFDFLGDNQEASVKANRAASEEEIIAIFVDWYYDKYLYRHNEQFIDLYEFFIHNLTSRSDKITEEIKDYFVLPFANIKTDEAYYLSLSVHEIVEKAIIGIGRDTLTNLEKILTSNYSPKIDVMLLLGHYRMNGTYEHSRLLRVSRHFSEMDLKEIQNSLVEIYGEGTTEAKLDLLNAVQNDPAAFGERMETFLEKVYSRNEKDLVYYGLLAQNVNKYYSNRRH